MCNVWTYWTEFMIFMIRKKHSTLCSKMLRLVKFNSSLHYVIRYMLDNRFKAHLNIWNTFFDLFPLSAGSFLTLVDVYVFILLLWCDTVLSVYAKSGQLASLTHTGSIVVVECS